MSAQHVLEKQTVLLLAFWKLLVNSCTWLQVYFVQGAGGTCLMLPEVVNEEPCVLLVLAAGALL